MTGHPDHDVIVVGAGPTGLLAAAELARRGADVALLDARSDGAAGTRAIGIHPPVLAALEESGATERILARAARVPRGVARSRGTEFGEVRFDLLPTRFPFVATVPQAVTEAAVARGGPPPRRGVRVVALHDRGSRVDVIAESAGTIERLSACLVVLAAGASGRVLVPASAAVHRHVYPDRYLMADVPDASTEPDDTAIVTLDEAGVLESFPLPGGGRRLVAWVGGHTRVGGAERTGNLGLRDALVAWRGDGDTDRDADGDGDRDRDAGADRRRLGRAVAARTGDERLAALVDEATVSGFGIRRVLTRRMRVGRIAIVGDAAHEVSPIGGQGMNLGLLDAVTVAPLLMRWLEGTEPAEALDRWERARLASARVAAGLAGLNTALGRPRSVAAHRLATGVLRVALSAPSANLPARAYAMGFDRDARFRRRAIR